MTDSYHYQIAPEPRVEVPKFRIGGVYRQKNGSLVYLADTYEHNGAAVTAGWAQARFVERDSHDGLRNLETGHYLSGKSDSISLIPGELTLRDGKWVAADAPIVFPSGAAVLTSGDKIVGRVELKAPSFECLECGPYCRCSAEPSSRALPNSDEWRGIGHKAHDPFGPDFIVTKGAEATRPLHTSPTTDSAYPAIAGLLRG